MPNFALIMCTRSRAMSSRPTEAMRRHRAAAASLARMGHNVAQLSELWYSGEDSHVEYVWITTRRSTPDAAPSLWLPPAGLLWSR